MQKEMLDSLMEEVDIKGDMIKEISDELVSNYCKTLDDLLKKIQADVQCGLSDMELEGYILDLANTLYFTGTAQEDLGMKEDICKAIRQEAYAEYRTDIKGTVADRTAYAESMIQNETIALAIYSRAYKKVKFRVDAGYEMLNSLKKIMNKRLAEMELSNSRYINHSGV